MGDTVTLAKTNADGSLTTTDVPIGEAAKWISAGYHPQTEGEGQEASQAAIDRTKYGGIKGMAATALAGTANALSGGASDVGIAALGGAETLRGLKSENPISDIAGNLAGTALSFGAGAGAPALFSKAGKATEAAIAGDGLLSKIGGAAAGGAVEGGLYGASSGVSELAQSNEPIDGEHIASVIGSKALLTGLLGGGVSALGKGVEAGLGRASAALRAGSEAQGAIDAIPEDLAGMDGKVLREAEQTEKASLSTQRDVEEQALKDARIPQRKQLADDLHEYQKTLADNTKIWSAINGEDVEAVAGVSKIGARVAKFDTQLRNAFDNPILVAKNPSVVLNHLTGQEAALVDLQAKIPEIKLAIAADATPRRADILDQVPDVLKANRELQARIEALDNVKTPITSPRLTELKSGTSPRLTAIQNAREALANAPDKGFVQKAAEGAAFAGGTAFAHMIPGVGIAAPFVGKYASEAVGALFSKLAGTGAKAAKATADNIDKFLNVSSKLPPIGPVLSSKVLDAARYATGGKSEPAKDIQEAFRARSAELRSQTMYDPTGQVVIRPEVRQKIGDTLRALATVNPLLADKTETVAVRKIEYTSSMIPRKPEMGGVQIGPDHWSPSDAQIRSFARTVAAVEDPAGVEERLAHGTITTEDADAYRNVYPERWKALQLAILPKLAALKQPIPMARRIALQIFTGMVIDPSLSQAAQAVFQGNFKNEAGSAGGTKAPTAQPSFGKFGSIKKSIEGPTPSQRRSG